jgi:hypothetical protein
MLWTVAHTYNPRYLGGRDCQDHSLKVAWTKKVWKTPISTNGWAHNLSYAEAEIRKIAAPG